MTFLPLIKVLTATASRKAKAYKNKPSDIHSLSSGDQRGQQAETQD